MTHEQRHPFFSISVEEFQPEKPMKAYSSEEANIAYSDTPLP